MCLYLAEEQDVLALAEMRQTALGQYLRGEMRWIGGRWVDEGLMMVQMGHSVSMHTEHRTPET